MNEKLDNYFFGELSEAGKKELFHELEQDEALKQEFARMQNIAGLSGLMPREEDQQWGEQHLDKLLSQQKRKHQTRRLSIFIRYAASAAAIIALTWMVTFYFVSRTDEMLYTQISVPKGQRVHLTLPDGSEAWLSSLSTLKWPSVFSADTRTVILDGEGFFTVTKDAARPFTVQTQKYNVQVLGTVFNVYAYNNSQTFETDLLSGKVRVSSPQHLKEDIILLPNEKVTLADGRLVKSESHFGGQGYREQGIYDFENQPLGVVLERLEQWYDVDFTVSNPALLQEAVSGKFRQSDQIETILQAIRRADLFNYEMTSQREIKIY